MKKVECLGVKSASVVQTIATGLLFGQHKQILTDCQNAVDIIVLGVLADELLDVEVEHLTVSKHPVILLYFLHAILSLCTCTQPIPRALYIQVEVLPMVRQLSPDGMGKACPNEVWGNDMLDDHKYIYQ